MQSTDLSQMLSQASSIEQLVKFIAVIHDDSDSDIMKKIQLANQSAEIIQCDSDSGREVRDEICQREDLLTLLYRFLSTTGGGGDVGLGLSEGGECTTAMVPLIPNTHSLFTALYMSTLSTLIIHDPTRMVEFLRERDDTSREDFINCILRHIDMPPYRMIIVCLFRVATVSMDTSMWLKDVKLWDKLVDVIRLRPSSASGSGCYGGDNDNMLSDGACQVVTDIIKSIRLGAFNTSSLDHTNTEEDSVIHHFISRDFIHSLLPSGPDVGKAEAVRCISVLISLIEPIDSSNDGNIEGVTSGDDCSGDTNQSVGINNKIQVNYVRAIIPYIKQLPAMLNNPPMSIGQTCTNHIGQVRVDIVRLLTYMLIIGSASSHTKRDSELVQTIICHNIIHTVISLFSEFSKSSVFHCVCKDFLRTCLNLGDVNGGVAAVAGGGGGGECTSSSSLPSPDHTLIRHLLQRDVDLIHTLVTMWTGSGGDSSHPHRPGYIGHIAHLLNLINAHMQHNTDAGKLISHIIDNELSSSCKDEWEHFITHELEEYNQVAERNLCGVDRAELHRMRDEVGGVASHSGITDCIDNMEGVGMPPQLQPDTDSTSTSLVVEDQLFRAFQQQTMSTPFVDEFGLSRLEPTFDTVDEPIGEPIDNLCNFDMDIHEDVIDVEEEFAQRVSVDISIFSDELNAQLYSNPAATAPTAPVVDLVSSEVSCSSTASSVSGLADMR